MGAALALVLLAAAALLVWAPRAPAAPTRQTEGAMTNAPTLDELYKLHGERWGVDWRLLKAIARVESSENPGAINRSDPSFGLMQILCQPDGRGGCKNRFFIDGWPPASSDALLDPDLSLHFGAQILADNIRRWGRTKGIAGYNSASAQSAPREGPFPNQAYVDKVMREYRALGGE